MYVILSHGFSIVYHSLHYSADYSASKAALVNLHESLRYELDKRYVLVFSFLVFRLT